MTATILIFPSRKATERLEQLGNHLTNAIPLPMPDTELDILITSAAMLLDNLNDAALDSWLDNVTAFDNR